MSALDKATRPDVTSQPGRYRVSLDGQWCVGDKLHGGYLLAVVARAAVVAAAGTPAHTAPHAVTGTFLRAPEPGPAEVGVEVLRRGRSASQLRVGLTQDGRACLEAAVTLGAPVPAGPGPRDPADGPAPPELTAHERCRRTPSDTDDDRGPLPLMDAVDTRLDPATAGFARGRPTGRGRLAGWGELADGARWDSVGLLVALDLLPPATFDLGLGGWTPTMSMTAHVPTEPAPGPVRLEQVLDQLRGDRMHETCRAWDADGRLVGIATQVAAVRR